MSQHHKNFRMVLVAAFALGTIVLSSFVLSPESEAADCGGHAGGVTHEWLATTPDAQTRNSANECGQGFECREWCVVSCGTEILAQGEFDCFPI